MLEPTERILLLDALRPPPGMILEHAVATTFTLDLEALLMAAIAFALFDAEDGRLQSVDPLSLLEAVRRNADRIDIFCQAGLIGLPSAYHPVLTQLEESIHPVAPGSHRIFHPKLWLMRYAEPDGASVHHRMLVLSRNLTFDKSWDVIVRLEQQPGTHRGFVKLGELVRWLPENSVQPLASRRRTRLLEMAKAIEQVGFKVPEPFAGDLAFHAPGIGTNPGIDEIVSGAERLLVISPFVGQGALETLTHRGPNAILISRSETLDRIPETTLDHFAEKLVLDPAATPEGDEAAPGDESAAPHAITGLHAKVFVAERGADAEWWIGSANATGAAFGANVETFLSMTGRRSRVGIDRFLDPDTDGSFRSLLRTYVRSDSVEEADSGEMSMEASARSIAAIPLTALIEPGSSEEMFRLTLTTEKPTAATDWPNPVFWPITLTRARGLAMPDPKQPVTLDFGEVTLTAITPFFAFEIEGTVNGRKEARTYVVRAQLMGDPEDRRQRVLTEQLKTKLDVLRYLLLLLTEFGDDTSLGAMAEALGNGGSSSVGRRLPTIPLFESMVRSLATNPTALDHVARLIDVLRSTEDGRELIPDGFEEVWDPIWEARQRL